jgi:hypothetical protein
MQVGFPDVSEQPSDPQQQSHAQRNRYPDGEYYEWNAEYDAHRRTHVADDHGHTPDATGEEGPGLTKRCCEACARHRCVFDVPAGGRHGLPPSQSVGESGNSAGS